jgi:hypothetical protein
LEIVLECTDSTTKPKLPWRERKEKYIEHLKNASKGASLIIMADKLHNADSIIKDHAQLGEAIWERFTGKKEGTKWYFAAILKALEANKSVNPALHAQLANKNNLLQEL